MGKVAQADFDEMAGRLRSRAIGLIQQLEHGDGYRALIERELEVRLRQRAEAPDAPPLRTEPLTLSCESCGIENDRDARFCKGCGARMPGAA